MNFSLFVVRSGKQLLKLPECFKLIIVPLDNTDALLACGEATFDCWKRFLESLAGINADLVLVKPVCLVRILQFRPICPVDWVAID